MAVPETCGACLRHPPALDATSATFQYRFPLDRLVRRFKFAGDLATGRWLGTALARAVDTSVLPDLLVAAPLTPARLRSRGFNQAVEIARVVAATHRVRFELGAIDKVRDTPAQRALNREERQANLQGAFRVRRPMRVAHVGIVDDVMTTGATADAMACALKEAGARRVSAWVVARTPEPGR